MKSLIKSVFNNNNLPPFDTRGLGMLADILHMACMLTTKDKPEFYGHYFPAHLVACEHETFDICDMLAAAEETSTS